MKKNDKKAFGNIPKRATCIYGPPEMLMKRRSQKEDQENTPEDIYGPPEMLGAITSGKAVDPTEEVIDVPDGEEDDI